MQKVKGRTQGTTFPQDLTHHVSGLVCIKVNPNMSDLKIK